MCTNFYKIRSNMNKQFLEQIIAVYGSSIYSFCIYLTQNITEADDLYQNTFIKAIELDNLNLSINPKSYLLGIASNLWKNEKRKRLLRIKKVPQISFEELEQIYLANTTCSPQEMLEKAETAREVKQAVYNMEDNHKEVILLYYMEELSIAEIAGVLNIPQNTVKSRLFQARKQLKKQLEDLK